MIFRRLSTFYVLLVALLLSLTSCGTIDTQPDNDGRMYIYTSDKGVPYDIYFSGVPYKINLTTGSSAPVCIDPLCVHDAASDCPLYDTGFALFSGDYMFYTRGSISLESNTNERYGSVRLCVYNMKTGNARQLAEYEHDLMLAAVYGQYCWFYVAEYEKDADAKASFVYKLRRADADNGKITEIVQPQEYRTDGGGLNTGDFPDIYTITDGRIYWIAPTDDGIEAYTTDLDGENRTALDFGGNMRALNGQYHDGFAYYLTPTASYAYSECESDLARRKYFKENTLRRVCLNGGADEPVADNVADYYICGGTVYYTVCELSPELIECNGQSYYDLFGGRVYCIDADGGNARLLCTTDKKHRRLYKRLRRSIPYAKGRFCSLELLGLYRK